MPESSSARALRVSAATIVAGALLSGPIAVLIVVAVAPQPAWTDVDAFARSYSPIQALPYLLGYILLGGFVMFAAVCHALGDSSMRLRTTAALVFTGVYAALVFTNYTIQLGYVPRIVAERPSFLGALTMSNPASFAWFLEMFGYAAMGVATWLVAPLFGGSRRGTLVRALLMANVVVSIVGAACTAAFDGWVFSTSGFASFAGWNILVIVCFATIAVSRDGALAAESRAHL